MLKCNSSDSLRRYIDTEAVRIYQSCYRDTRLSSFTVKDYNGYDKLNDLTGIISSYDCVRHQYNVTIKRSHDDTLPEYKCALSPGFLEPAHPLGKEFNWSTYHLSRSSKNPTSKVVQLRWPYDTSEQESTLSMTDMQPILQFRYALFETLRRRFPRPEQASNGVSVKLLMTELDREEHADRVALDGLYSDQVNYSEAYRSMMVKYTSRQDQPTRKRMRTHETCSTAMRLDQINAVRQANCEHLIGKSNKTLPEAMSSNHFVMPFIVSDGSLHTAGAGLNEFDLINNHKYTLSEIDSVIAKEFSRESMVQFDDFSFESLRPGQEIGDSVCDLCLKW